MAIIKRLSSKATPKKLINYLTKGEKTEEKLISGKDCSPENVLEEFKATKELYEKNSGVQYHHIIQSFDPKDNITPEKAHEIGKELAESQFKGHEVLIVTHKDKDHIHNHLVVNSVNFENGKKYRATNKSLWDLKRESNRICERENLKTIDLNKKAPERITSSELRIVLRGQTSWKDELRQCIDFAKERTNNINEFRQYLKDNFNIETRITNKTISYKHPDKKKPIRGKKLGQLYTKGELENEFTRKEKAVTRTARERNSGIQQSNKTIDKVEPNIKTGIREFSTEGVISTITRTIEEISRRARQEPERTERTIQRNREQDRAIKNQQRDTKRTNKPRVRERDFELER